MKKEEKEGEEDFVRISREENTGDGVTKSDRPLHYIFRSPVTLVEVEEPESAVIIGGTPGTSGEGPVPPAQRATQPARFLRSVEVVSL